MTLTVTLCLVALVLGFALGVAVGNTIKRDRLKEAEIDQQWRAWAARHRAKRRANQLLQQRRSRQQGGTPAA